MKVGGPEPSSGALGPTLAAMALSGALGAEAERVEFFSP